ncbi:uncharacterized protein DSM5745_09301 [Aspergillus mulundensis]|uniref:Uncharacterized protein n=1 Tax=Aspergillus mulundensis TaxID=1810919 RepID=A0A3D8R0A8_9EURO|nr:hypothetical protein DSM5745_09301 [Aspergillus mulundensis]RDW67435.1 hypothetical protein DSM5745_09301 [Aspergillus mulundensis]
MGKIQLPPSPQATATNPSSASSLPDELPSYDEVTQPIEPYRDAEQENHLSPPPNAYHIPGQQRYNSIRPAQRFSGSVTLDPDYSRHAETLERFIEAQTRLPPRPCLSVHGTHKESRRSGNETKTENVTDFDFRIDLTRTILRWGRNELSGPSERWSYTTVVSDTDGQKAYRGGRIKARSGKKTGRIALGEGDEGERLMDLENQEDYPGVKGWCERFCNDPAPVKSFTYRRSLHGFDARPMRDSLTSHIRSTGYAGHIVINPVVANGFVTVYSPHWINTLRNNAYVYWICIILQLWILTWPLICFMERRYEVVHSKWFSSKTVCDASAPGGVRKCYAAGPGMDEARAAEMWAPVVREAAWQGRVDGCILGEAEIEELRRKGIERREQLGENGNDLPRRGQSVLGAMGIRSIGGVNVTGAWGGDSSSASSSRFSIRMG